MSDTNPTNMTPELLARYQAKIRKTLEGNQRVFSPEDFYNGGSSQADGKPPEKRSGLDSPGGELGD
jgi:hypothetical protein